MKRQSIAIMMFVASMSCAYAQESVPLCSAPLDPDCVDPKWGQIQPDALESTGPTTGNAAIAPHAASADIHVAILPVATTNGSPKRPATLTAVIDATRMFASQTRLLTTAIKNARFNRQGAIVRGGPEIAAAAEAARKPAAGYALTLYIKAPLKLGAAQRAALNGKIVAINEALGTSSDRQDPSKPKS